MTDYIIFACPKCGTIRYAREGQRTAKCLKCGYQVRMDLTGVRVLARAKDARDAVELVKLYKAKLK